MLLEMFLAVGDTQSRLNWSFFYKIQVCRQAGPLCGTASVLLLATEWRCQPRAARLFSTGRGTRVYVCTCARTRACVHTRARGGGKLGLPWSLWRSTYRLVVG